MSSTTITLDSKIGPTAHNNIADAMVMNGNLRYATMEGNPSSKESGQILSVRSQRGVKVGVKAVATGKTETHRYVRFAETDEENNIVYLSGPGWVDRTVGEIVRVRRMILP